MNVVVGSHLGREDCVTTVFSSFSSSLITLTLEPYQYRCDSDLVRTCRVFDNDEAVALEGRKKLGRANLAGWHAMTSIWTAAALSHNRWVSWMSPPFCSGAVGLVPISRPSCRLVVRVDGTAVSVGTRLASRASPRPLGRLRVGTALSPTPWSAHAAAQVCPDRAPEVRRSGAVELGATLRRQSLRAHRNWAVPSHSVRAPRGRLLRRPQPRTVAGSSVAGWLSRRAR